MCKYVVIKKNSYLKLYNKLKYLNPYNYVCIIRIR